MRSIPWIFSPTLDLFAFLGSAVIALGLLGLALPVGSLTQDTPEWLWVAAVLMIDVAHVYATGFRVYFDWHELRRRPWLYGLTPLLALSVGWALHSESPRLFWRLLAYLAVFHFVRQQYGWVALYRARGKESGKLGWYIDASAIYLATLYPLVFWHTNLPRRFWWFLPGDFTELPKFLESAVRPVYWFALGAYATRSLYRTWVLRRPCPGKDIVLGTTAICWYVGIITFNSDYAFTVTNVITHGIPYIVLVYWFQTRPPACATEVAAREDVDSRDSGPPRLVTYLGVIWALAFLEEMCWDCGVWHERGWLFGEAWTMGTGQSLLVATLAVPQITHYVLDGFIWRRRENSRFAAVMASNAQSREQPDG